jgi:hypothetical protein
MFEALIYTLRNSPHPLPNTEIIAEFLGQFAPAVSSIIETKALAQAPPLWDKYMITMELGYPG